MMFSYDVSPQGVEAEEKVEILTSNDMLNMMYQIACGMVSDTLYWFNLGIVHTYISSVREGVWNADISVISTLNSWINLLMKGQGLKSIKLFWRNMWTMPNCKTKI